uniref:RRM domain-containing protein n=3 Tax=Plectus sambesii TaxID=2011161 RepID=A0A914XQ35_9BILA
MQGPPRFQMMPGYGGVTMVPVPFVQTPTYFMPSNLLAGGQRLISQAPIRKPPPVEKPPQTTAFVGNIHDRCSNDLIRAMLQECGNVVSWKRIQGSSGKFQAFGFCEFDHPESTLRALRLLHDMRLGDKKLVVKVDEKTGELLRSFVAKQRQQQGKPALQLSAGEMPKDEEMTKNDEHYLRAINLLIEHEAPDLLSTEDGEITSRSPTLQGKGGNLDVATLDRDKKEYIRDEIERFRQTHK